MGADSIKFEFVTTVYVHTASDEFSRAEKFDRTSLPSDGTVKSLRSFRWWKSVKKKSIFFDSSLAYLQVNVLLKRRKPVIRWLMNP